MTTRSRCPSVARAERAFMAARCRGSTWSLRFIRSSRASFARPSSRSVSARHPEFALGPARVDRDPLHLAGSGGANSGSKRIVAAQLPQAADQLEHVGLAAGADVDRRRCASLSRGRENRRDDIADIDVVAGLAAVAKDRRPLARRAALRRRSRSRPPRRAGPAAARRRCRAAGGRGEAVEPLVERQVALAGELALAVGRRSARSARPRSAAAPARRPRRRSLPRSR